MSPLLGVPGPQFGVPDPQYGATGHYDDASSDADDNLQDTGGNGEFATPEQLVGYLENVGHLNDYLNQNAHLFRTKVQETYTVSVSRPVIGASGVILPGSALLTGINFAETAGAAAKVRIRNGQDAGQPILMTIALAANASVLQQFASPIESAKGLFLEVVSGNVEGAVFTLEKRNR
jgi:hypothetical protein